MCVFLENTGAGFSSKSKYMYGKVTLQIRLVEGDSAGTVTAFYVSLIVQCILVAIQDSILK